MQRQLGPRASGALCYTPRHLLQAARERRGPIRTNFAADSDIRYMQRQLGPRASGALFLFVYFVSLVVKIICGRVKKQRHDYDPVA